MIFELIANNTSKRNIFNIIFALSNANDQHIHSKNFETYLDEISYVAINGKFENNTACKFHTHRVLNSDELCYVSVRLWHCEQPKLFVNGFNSINNRH